MVCEIYISHRFPIFYQILALVYTLPGRDLLFRRPSCVCFAPRLWVWNNPAIWIAPQLVISRPIIRRSGNLRKRFMSLHLRAINRMVEHEIANTADGFLNVRVISS